MKIGGGLRHWGPNSFCLEELWEGPPLHLRSISMFLVATEASDFTVHLRGYYYWTVVLSKKKASFCCVFSWIFRGDALTQTVCRIRQLTFKVLSHSKKYKHHELAYHRPRMVGEEKKRSSVDIQEGRKMEKKYHRTPGIKCFPAFQRNCP